MTSLVISTMIASGLAGCVGVALGSRFSSLIERLRYRYKLCRLARRFETKKLVDDSHAWYGVSKPILWAHAGGGKIHAYGNSKEAIADSIARGFKVIEVDVELTSDGVPVLSHRFCPDGQIAFDHRPSLDEFLATKINGRYTPLTLNGLFAEFFEYDGVFAIDSWGIACCRLRFDLPQYICGINGASERTIYLANSLEEGVRLARERRFASVHCGLPAGIDTEEGIWQLPYLVRIYTGAGIRSVSITDKMISKFTECVVCNLRNSGVHVSVIDVETEGRCRKWMDIGADCFNTRLLEPSMF